MCCVVASHWRQTLAPVWPLRHATKARLTPRAEAVVRAYLAALGCFSARWLSDASKINGQQLMDKRRRPGWSASSEDIGVDSLLQKHNLN